MIQGLLIDLDDTLIDRTGAVIAWLNEVLGAQHIEQALRLDACGYGNRTEFYKYLSADTGWSLAQVKNNFYKGLLVHLRLMPGALQFIKRIPSHVRVAIATNGLHAIQHEKINVTGLNTLIANNVISESIGARKPQATFFKHALAIIGTSPRDTLMIGDHLENDIKGASQVGIKTCLLRKEPLSPMMQGPSAIIPDQIVTQWDQVSLQ